MVKISHKGLEWHSLILISTVLIQPFSLSCNLQHATMPIEIDSGPTRPSVTKMGIAADAEGFFELELG